MGARAERALRVARVREVYVQAAADLVGRRAGRLLRGEPEEAPRVLRRDAADVRLGETLELGEAARGVRRAPSRITMEFSFVIAPPPIRAGRPPAFADRSG